MATIAATPHRLSFRWLVPSVLILIALTWLSVLVLASWPTGRITSDFDAFYVAGRAVRAGLNPYLSYPVSDDPATIPARPAGPDIDSPPSLPAFAALSLLPPMLGFRLVWLASLLGYLVLVAVLSRVYHVPPWRWLWALAFIPAWDTARLGQTYIPLAALAVGAWLALRSDHRVAAGVCLGALAVLKPNFAAWPAALLLAGALDVATISIATALVLAAIPTVLAGPGVWVEWVQAIFATHADQPISGSVFGVAALFHQPAFEDPVGIALALALLVGLAAFARRHRHNLLAISALALVVACLASPIAWSGFLVILLPLWYWRPWNPLTGAAAVLAVIPFAMFPIAAVSAVLPVLLALGVASLHPPSHAPLYLPPTFSSRSGCPR